MQLVELIILGMAGWRIGRMLQGERGPLSVFTRVRMLLGIEHDDDGEPVSWPDTELGRLARCLDCGSVWVSFGLAGLYFWQPGLALVLALPFALSAIVIGVGVMIDGQGRH